MARPKPPPDLSRRGALRDFWCGATLLFRGALLILTQPRILLIALLCGLVTLVTLVVMVALLWPWSQQLAAMLIASGEGVWQRGFRMGLSILLFVLLSVLGALTVPNLVLAPLTDPLSEATEAAVSAFSAPPFRLGLLVRGILFSLTHTLLRLFLTALGWMLLYPLHLVPVVGSLGFFVLSSLWSMFCLAVEHLSTPMVRHFQPVTRAVVVLSRRPALALGFGLALAIMLFVPVVNFFLLPLAIVGGTLLFVGLTALGELPRT